jgi:hypothetical protein
MQRRFRLRRSLNAAEAGDAFWIQIGQQEPPAPEERSQLLCAGAITAYELVPWGSNYTFLVALAGDDGQPRAIGIYKPRQGEAPLWDFPDGTLYRREYAAYLLSRQLGWVMIPETVIREGPYGVGTVQTYIEVADDTHYFTLRESHTADLQQIAVFDIITNNADRKAGHLFQGKDGTVYGIDHGLTFNTQPKLRTVIWDFADEPVPDTLLHDLETRLLAPSAASALRAQLAPLLERGEIDRFFARVERLLATRVYPGFNPGRSHNIPWGFL